MNAAQYIKNVGKSMGYIAIDTFKSMNPAVAEFYANAKELSTDLYQTIDDFKGKAISNDAGSIKSTLKNTAAETWQNARDDFLSGKWYNKERKNAADNEMLKGMGIDLEAAFDFDLDDFGDFDDDLGSSSDDLTKADMVQEEKSTKEVVGVVNASVASAANTITAATAKSTEYMVAVQNENTATMYNLNIKGFNNIGIGLNAINSNLSALLSLAEPLTNHMQNSATFYTKSTELQQETVSLLRKLVDHVVPDKSGARTRKKSVDDYIGDGGINFAAMFTDMKEAVSSTVKDLKEMADMFGGGNSISKQVSASPISSVLQLLLPILIPGSNKRSMEWFNKSLKSLGYGAYGKLSHKFGDSLIGSVLDLLGFSLPKNSYNKEFSTSNYEKGKVDWDGKSRKALMEVIPYYLSKMTAIMEGTKEIELFNYETGKFETKAKIKERKDKYQKELASSYTYEFNDRIRKSNKNINKSDLENFNLLLAIEGGTNLYDLISTSKKTRDAYIKNLKSKSKEAKDFLDSPAGKKIIKLIDNAAENSDRSDFNKFDLEEVLMETGNLRSRLREEKARYEESGEFDALHRNGRDIKVGGLLGGLDSNGFTALDYLRGIYINTMGAGGGGAGAVDPLGYNRAVNDKIAKAKEAQAKAEADRGNAPIKSRTSTKKEETTLREHYATVIKDDEAWDEMMKNTKYKDYLTKRYEKELQGLSVDDDDPIWKEIKTLDTRKRIKGKIKDFADKFGIGDRLKGFFDAVTENLKTPAALFDTMITTFRSTLHDIIFSDKGLFGWLFDKEKGVLRKPLQKVFGFVDSRVGTNFGDWFGFNNSGSENGLADLVPNAYNGRVVRRTGLAAVSEGEIIIPAEFNSKYNKRINKSQQRRNENRAISRFFGGYANGGIAGGASNVQEKPDNTIIGRSKNLLKKGFTEFGYMLYDTFTDITGANTKEAKAKEKKDIIGIVKGAVDDIKPHAADAILGGMAGGGISILTGAVISPVLGAALGAASGLVMSSEKVRDFLFGKISVDENGKETRDGGLMGDTGAKIRKFVEDQLPDTLLGGALGGAGGALLGHPVLGMFLGAGAGFISKSKGVQNFLFGEIDEKTGKRKGGLLSQELQDQIKKIAPGMGAGAITGLVSTAFGGPFGLVGNMLVGSVLGGIASTDSFKDFFFGEKGENGKREGGLVQVIRTSVLDPTRESFFNLAERIRSDFRAIAVNFFDGLKNAVVAISNGPLGDMVKGAFDRIKEIPGFGKVAAKAKDFASLRNLSTRIAAGNIRRGINVRDKNGKLLSAKERINLLKGTKYGASDRYLNSTGYKTTQLLAGMKKSSSLEKFNDFVNEFYGADTETRRKMMSQAKYSKYIERLGLNENTSKSDLMKMRDAIKVEGESRFDAKIVNSIDASDAISNIKRDINKIYQTITGKNKKLLNVGEEDIDDSTTEGKNKLSRITKNEKLMDSLMESIEATKESQENTKEYQDEIIGTDPVKDNDKESKKSGLLGKFFGEDSFIGKAAKFIVNISKIIPVVAIAGLFASATGVFDKLAAKLGIGFGSADNTSITTAGGTSSVTSIFKFWGKDGGSTTNAGGTAEDISVSFTDTASLSDRAWSTIGRQAPEIVNSLLHMARAVVYKQSDDFIKILQKIPLVGKYFADSKFAKGIADFMDGLYKNIDNILKGLPSGADDVAEAGSKILAQNSDDIAKTAGKTAGKAVGTVGKTTLKDIINSATVVLSVAFAIADFTAGMQDAETTMKVKKATIPEKILCGILRAAKNDIPYLGILGGLVPDSLLYNLLLNTVGKAMGLKEGVDQRRAEAQAELDAYNQANGTNYNWSQYEKTVLDNKTWTERAWEGIKTGAVRTVEGFKHPGQTFMNALGGFKEGFAENNGTMYGKLMSGLGNFTDIMAPGVLGNIQATLFRAWAHVDEGDVAALWKENLDFFSKDNDPITAIMSNVVNLPLLQIKIIGTPLALIQRMILNVRDGFKEFEFGDNPFASFFEDYFNISLHAMAGDIGEMWKYKPNLNTGNKFIEGLNSVFMTITKVMDTPFAGVMWLVKKVWNFADDVKEKIAGAIDFEGFLSTGGEIMKNTVVKPDPKGLWEVENPEKGKGGFNEVIGNVMTFGSKILMTPFSVENFLASKAGEFAGKTVKGIKKGIDYLKTEGTKGDDILYSDEGSFSELFNIPEPDSDIPLKGLFKTGAVMGRVLGVGIEVVKGAVRTIASMIADSDLGQTASAITTNGINADKYMLTGDIINLWNMTDNNSAKGGFWKFISGADLVIRKITNTPIALVSRAVQDLVTGIAAQVDPAKETFSAIGTDVANMWDYTIHGELVDLAGYETTANQDGEHPMWGGLATVVTGAVRMVMAPVGLVTAAGGLLADQVSKGIEAIKTAASFAKDQVQYGIDMFENDPTNWETNIVKGLDPDAEGLEAVFQVGTVGLRYLGAPIVLTKMIGNKIGTVIGNFTNPIKDDASLFRDSMSDLVTKFDDTNATFNDIFDMQPTFASPIDGIFDFAFAFSKIMYGSMKLITGFVGDLVSGFNWGGLWDNLKSIASFKKDGGGSGSGIGGGSSFVSQIDPRYAGKSLGGYNVGAMGCGPAAASMVLGNSMNANINAARGYQTNGGTDLSYFGDVFSRNGKHPIYYNLSGGASGQDMISDISSGKPVVLMGRDPYNTSKRYSPFGPGNHYVVARGFRNGGIVIDDPESPVGGRVYSPSILRNVSAAVGAGSSGLRRKRLYGIGAGAAMVDNTIAKQIWAYFKQQGYADGAVAGILGNIQSESSFNLEAKGDKQNGKYTSYGLCQWHNSRWTNLRNYANSIGKDQSDLDAQLGYLKQELDGGAAGSGFSSINDPAKAADQFCRVFERPQNPDGTSPGRQQNAIGFYNAFSGKNYTYEGGVTGSTSGSTGSSTSTATKPLSAAAKFLGLTSTIGNAFTSALGNTVLGKVGNLFSSAFGGNDSSSDISTVTTGSNGTIQNNDVGVTSWPGKQPVEYMRDVLGKLKYSTSNRDPEKGGGDCSSTVAWALTKAGLPVTSDSRWQYMNEDLKTHPSWQNVLWYNNGKPLGKGNPIPVALQPNDVIFYSHGGSNYPDHVDHVEMYNGNNEIIGNGGGIGTRTRPVSAMQDQIIKIVRPNASWSSGGGSGLDLSDLRPTGRKESTIRTNGKIYSMSEYKRMKSGGASELTDNTALILKTMLTFIESLVNNTKDIKAIYELLAKYCSGSLTKAETAAALNELNENSTDNDKIEDSLASLKATVDSILAS